MPPDEPNDEERQEELPQDNQTPFQPADPPRDDTMPPDSLGQPGASSVPVADDTHPVTDTDVDQQELYDAGTTAATGATEPEAANDVVGFNPPASAEDDSNDGQDQTPS